MSLLSEALSVAALKYWTLCVDIATREVRGVRVEEPSSCELPTCQKRGRRHLPDFVQETLLSERVATQILQKKHTVAALRKTLEFVYDSRFDEESFRSSQPMHVGVRQIDKQHVSTRKLGKLAGSSESVSSREHMRFGVPVVGAVTSNNNFGKEFKTKRTDRKLESSDEQIVIPTEPPSWMSKKNNKRLWREWKEETNLISELRKDQLKRTPNTAFGVEQGEKGEFGLSKKSRRILDWSKGNENSPIIGKIRLISHLGVTEAIRLALAVSYKTLPTVQGKKDIRVDGEFLSQEEQEAIARDQKNGVLDKTWEEYWKTMTSESSSFVPHMGKIDFRKFFHQFAVSRPDLSTIAMCDADEDRVRFFFSDYCQFGNIHSIFVAVRHSELLMRIVNCVFHVPSIIYIDDTIIFCKKENLEVYLSAITVLFSVLGYWLSADKIESHSVNQKCLTVLGLNYTASKDSILLTAPTVKIDKSIALIKKTIEKFALGECKIRMIQELLGNIIYVIYFSTKRRANNAFQTSHQWCAEEVFHNRKKKKEQRIEFVASLLELTDIVSENPHLEIRHRKVVALATDASLEKGVSVLGGVDEVGRAFSLDMKEDWAKEIAAKHGLSKGNPVHIQIFELLAALIMIILRGKDTLTQGCQVLLDIDSIAAVYALVKGGINNMLADIITEAILDYLGSLGVYHYCSCTPSRANIAGLYTRSERFEEHKNSMEFTMDERCAAALALEEAERLISSEVAARTERLLRAQELLEQGKEKREEEKRKKEKRKQDKKTSHRMKYTHTEVRK